jgi:serine/threonine-protein kinase
MMNRGDKLAHYTIESMLGSGGMGAVYLAVDSRLHRRVALKVMLDSDKPEDVKESAARLLREARAAASLTHPNVVGVFDVGEIDGRVYLAMEYVVGKTLRELMRDDSIPWQRRLRWLVEVARALGAAHREGLVHRDIKPENVMVRDDGLVKVLDFGIARRTAAPVDPTGRTEQVQLGTLTGKGMVIGTPMYMAPEQLKGGDPDTRTDQFAWGVMSYEVLSGERPWPEKSDLLASVATILTEDPTSLRKHAPELPPAVEATVARALARHPEDRFETMEDVAELLDPLAVRSGPTIESRGRSKAMTDSPKASKESARATKRATGVTSDEPKPESEHKSTKQVMVTAKSPEHPLAPKPQPRESFLSRRRWSFVAGALAAAMAIGVYYKYFRKTPIVGPTVTSASSSPPIVLPPPVALTENADALAAYQEGVQQWRDGSARRSRASLERATALDPGFAAAQLELALQALVSRDGSRAQERYHKAYSHRDRLSARDERVLAALDPLVRASVDLPTAEQRLIASAAKMNSEPVFEYLLGYVREMRTDYEQARTAYESAIARDPTFMPALLAKGHMLVQLGFPEAALAAFGQCIRASSAAAICLEQRLLLLRDRGECDSMEQDARAWQTVEPDAPEPSYWVAAALMARDAPMQSVEVALRQQWDLLPKDERAAGEAEDTANLALAQGDFAGAERATRDWDAALVKPEVILHSGPQRQLAYIAFETNDMAQAGRVADAFLKVLPAYTPSPMGGDPTIWAQEYLFRTGRITKADLDDKRKTWLKEQEANRTQDENRRLGPFRWAQLYGGFAESLDEARDALDKLPDFLPLPPDSRRTAAFDTELGKVYALANHNDEALPPLRAVTSACIRLGSPIEQTRSFYFLGMALENKGDLDGARKAYQVVVDRWGNAKPKSRTAEDAKKRLKLLE